MDAILISVNPSIALVDDAIRHLDCHPEVYWEVGFPIKRDQFTFPIYAYMHIKRQQVEYRATVRDILPSSSAHYEEKELAPRVKPAVWLQHWKEQKHPWKHALVFTEVVPFSYDTYKLQKLDGTLVDHPPQGFMRVLLPIRAEREALTPVQPSPVHDRPSLVERNLEDFTIHWLEEIEPGLRLVERQLSTPAGRLDLLCKDAAGNYVVIELKRTRGTDQVVGQILRYMGWLQEEHRTDKVRGIVIVAKKDPALVYAASAVPNIQVKEYGLRFA